ncbi:uncharacterized protein TNCV_4877591 [Trichonephila clavipes]|nr:uncharacterized protein TNCV_4877591 [Trichonephila clavipes]
MEEAYQDPKRVASFGGVDALHRAVDEICLGYPLKTKRGTDIVKAFKTTFSMRKPKFLQTDAGTEFTNKTFQKFLKQEDVRFFTTHNNTKASVIERFNRTLKTKMWKYFTHNHTYEYVHILNDLLHSYNHTYHSSIKRTPTEVTQDNENDVWFTLYGDMEGMKKSMCFRRR